MPKAAPYSSASRCTAAAYACASCVYGAASKPSASSTRTVPVRDAVTTAPFVHTAAALSGARL
ncbi:MAG: hypothetical protein ACLRWF_11140 [Ruthenibacterium sp.]